MPERPNQHESLLRAARTDAPGEAEQRRVLHRRAGFFEHFPVKGCPPILVSFGTASREIPGGVRGTDEHGPAIQSETDSSRAMRRSVRRRQGGRMPRHKPILASGMVDKRRAVVRHLSRWVACAGSLGHVLKDARSCEWIHAGVPLIYTRTPAPSTMISSGPSHESTRTVRPSAARSKRRAAVAAPMRRPWTWSE